MLKSCCAKLITFLLLIASKFANSEVAVLISNKTTGVVTSKISMLQISLGLLVQKKQLTDHLYE